MKGKWFISPGRALKGAFQDGWIKKYYYSHIKTTDRAFFVCFSKEEVRKIASRGNIPLEGQPDLLLYEWIPGLLNNLKKVVSYGGWLAIKGLPLHWWISHFFKQIGDVCGGLIKLDKRIKKREYLYDARIKVRNNKSGFLPELVKLT